MREEIKYNLKEYPDLYTLLREVGNEEGNRRGDGKIGAATIAKEILIWYFKQDPTLKKYLETQNDK